MNTLLLLTTVAVIGIVWHRQRARVGRTNATAKTPTALSATQYKSVVIVPGLLACKAAEALKDKKLLRNDAPVLPLVSCTQGQCHCKFIRYDDRRTEERRNASYVARSVYVDNQDKRAKKERRKTT